MSCERWFWYKRQEFGGCGACNGGTVPRLEWLASLVEEEATTRLRLKLFVRSLLGAAVVGASFISVHGNASALDRSATCRPFGERLSAGVLPHRSFSLGDDRFNRPLASDGKHILMGLEVSHKGGGPIRLSVLNLQSMRLAPVSRGAYPPRTFLDQWQMEWPWIVGVAYTTPLPALPANWRLWVGNAATGQHFILDSYRAHRHPVSEFFPGFALNGGRVVWEYSSARSMRGNPFPAQRIALENLKTHRKKYLTASDPNAVYERITFSGTRVVWESAGIAEKKLAVDLLLYDLQTQKVTRLSRNTTRANSSLYPRLAGRFLLFEQGPHGSDYGTPYLVDLGAKTSISTRRWWRGYRFWRLDRLGLTNTQMGYGLVSWDDSRLLDVTRSKVWLTGDWMVDAIAGRIVLAHMDEEYVAWLIPRACAVPGF